VVSGRPVEIRWARNGVEVTMEGKAAGSGALGEEVFVRTGTGERLRGVVRGPGTVVIHEGTREERP
jgi:flagella basal body P-ring formation protein FlgA